MDPALAAASRALARGDPLRALEYVALRSEPRALALRGTAMAQLGEYPRARQLLLQAERAFAARDPLAHARCVVARIEVALAARDLRASEQPLDAAIVVLHAHGDRHNAQYAQLLAARYALCLGELAAAAERLNATSVQTPPLRALWHLAEAELALRGLAVERARRALQHAAQAARAAAIPALSAEVARTAQLLREPVARLAEAGSTRNVSLEQVATLTRGNALVVDACRRSTRAGEASVSFATRPVLFALLRQLAQAAPGDVARAALIEGAFGFARESAALRVRLRVEIGRLRKLIAGLAGVEATARGYVLRPRAPRLCVLLPPFDDEGSQLCALIADGAAWSSSAAAIALGTSQRSVQRALSKLEQAGKLRSVGHGRNRRWLAPPLTPLASVLLFRAPSRAGE
jgi:hypothetical protein